MPRISAPERLARDLDWNLLRVFVALAEAGSVTRAAEHLNLKQPSVSAALKRLEDRVGARLIDRARGRFHLTAAGQRLLEEAREVQMAILRLADRITEAEGQVTGHVTVALASHVVCPLFDAVLVGFFADHPGATISLEVMPSSDAVAMVAARRASMALCLLPAQPSGVVSELMYRETFGLFCGRRHPFFGVRELPPDGLAGQAVVSFQTDRDGDALGSVTALRRRLGLDDKVVGSSAHLEEVRRMIEAGLGVGPLPLHVVARDLADGRLWQLPPHRNLPVVDVHLCHAPSQRRNPAEAEFLSRLKSAIASTPLSQRTYGIDQLDE
jgi:DNA-binding transcriptional LysR family regulator